MRSEDEIKKETEAGEKFVKDHPRSLFGTDNIKHFRIFQKIVEKALRGESVTDLEDFADDAYDDEEENLFAMGVIEWLFYDGDPIYSE